MATELRAVEIGEPAPISFDDFWLLYPRHIAKKDARKMWARIPEREYVVILTALVSWRPVWRDKDPEYLPHPATWPNGERWEDELPAGYRPASTTPVTMITAPLAERTPIPAHVLAVMAKLRGKT